MKLKLKLNELEKLPINKFSPMLKNELKKARKKAISPETAVPLALIIDHQFGEETAPLILLGSFTTDWRKWLKDKFKSQKKLMAIGKVYWSEEKESFYFLPEKGGLTQTKYQKAAKKMSKKAAFPLLFAAPLPNEPQTEDNDAADVETSETPSPQTTSSPNSTAEEASAPLSKAEFSQIFRKCVSTLKELRKEAQAAKNKPKEEQLNAWANIFFQLRPLQKEVKLLGKQQLAIKETQQLKLQLHQLIKRLQEHKADLQKHIKAQKQQLNQMITEVNESLKEHGRPPLKTKSA
ncbi:hypothetical protein SapgrDRAFT_2399 [Saprospira grandis DSM 2844]|uniref:Uncharacterized protein n=1 Tax=Saprospira grandis DSM 2844 TaxID=694433 RepID=J1I5K6_9BACT|nr:hypothetical protein [Saprospira grandis]EJF54065.1 hypothetical protein SapgrDRAFT_2399 [Saprospira grandis DSM 2844]